MESESKNDEIKGKDEKHGIYDELHVYLTSRQYPEAATKAEKAVIRKRSKSFAVVNGIIHHKDKKDGEERLRQVVTSSATKTRILEACHNDKVGGCHFGRDRTIDKVSARFYWNGIVKDVTDWVKRCEVCQRTKRKFDRPAPSLHPIPVTDTWKMVGIDLIQLPISRRGNAYCITLTDYFSKWAEAEAVPTKDACHVANFLHRMILRFGCPEVIISDQGREFCNRLIDLLEELTGFRHNITSAYHPQSNGLDERLNQTLKSQLQKLVNENQDDWDDLLDSVLFSYRTSRQASTKHTPFLLMYGREARLPIDIIRPQPKEDAGKDEMPFEEKLQKTLEIQKKIHDRARGNIKKAQESQKRQYDAKHNCRTNVKVGDRVLVQDMKNVGRKGGKLAISFPGGPYTVVEDLGKGRFRVKDGRGRVLKKAVNCHRLKLWCDPKGSTLKRLKRKRKALDSLEGCDGKHDFGKKDSSGQDESSGEDDMLDKENKPPKRKKHNLKRGDWVPELALNQADKDRLESGAMLQDTHMHAAHKLIRKQSLFAVGCQSTLLCQTGGFQAVSGEAVQIHYNGHMHWVATACLDGKVYLFDSLAGDILPSSLEEQIAAIYGDVAKKSAIMVTRVAVQQQSGSVDCGLFAIAYAFHAALGDDVSQLRFDQSQMRRHLLKCFSQQELTPFPETQNSVSTSATKHHFVHLYCSCRRPESYDRFMIQCDACDEWYHVKCVGLSKSKFPKKWLCKNCK